MNNHPTFQDIPASHHGDPIPSLAAETAMNKTGIRATQCLELLAVIRRHPDSTRGELAFIMAKEDASDEDKLYLMIARRVSDLKHAGLVTEGKTRQCLRRRRIVGTLKAIDND